MGKFKFLAFFFLLPFLGHSQSIAFKKVKPCSFGIEIPADMKIQKMYSDSSADYCDYEVKSKDGHIVMEIHSLLASRFSYNTIKDLFKAAHKTSTIKITYEYLGSNFFVISGKNKKNGNIVYWKRVLGNQFVSDLNIEYNESRKAFFEKNIGRISKSFVSE